MTEPAIAHEWRARAEAFVPTVMRAYPDIVDIDVLWGKTKDTPLYVPREYFREAARATTEAKTHLELINRLPDESLIPRRWTREGYQRIQGSYRYVIETTGWDIDVGGVVTRRGAFDSDKALTIGEVYDQSAKWGATSGPVAMTGPIEMRIAHAFHRSGAPW